MKTVSETKLVFFFFISTLKFFHFQIFKLKKSVILHFILNINESTKRILAFAKPHQKYLFLSIFFNLLYSVFQIFSVLVMLPVLQMIFNVDQEKNYQTCLQRKVFRIFFLHQNFCFLQHPRKHHRIWRHKSFGSAMYYHRNFILV